MSCGCAERREKIKAALEKAGEKVAALSAAAMAAVKAEQQPEESK